MGLAASQARFLAITSRKMNCEFQSMQIAQDKLSVTRDLQAAATKYQNSMNATKLVFDTDMDEVYDLSYDLLMTPSALNDYNPLLITDQQGKLVLSDSMFQAAVNAGIIDEKGDPIADVDVFNKSKRDAFIDQLVSTGNVASSTAETVKAQDYTKSGIGGEILDKTIANALTSTAFISELGSKYEKDTTEGPNDEYKFEKGDLKYGFDTLDKLDSTKYKNGLLSVFASAVGVDETHFSNPPSDDDWKKVFCIGTTGSASDGQVVITKNGSTTLTLSEIQNLSLGDLLSGEYSMSVAGKDIKDYASNFLTAMATLLGYQAGTTTSNGIGLNVDSEAAAALEQALAFTKLDITGDPVAETGAGDRNGSMKNTYNLSQDYNGIIKGSENVQTISLTNLLKSYLTNFAIAIDGALDTEFVVSDTVKDSIYATDDLSYYFLVQKKEAVTDTDILTADYYNQLFNQLCMNGATTDSIKRDLVKDPEYLMQALKNGQLFISCLNTDGYFYQGNYTLNGYIQEVADEEAIAQAEMEYEITKTKLNYKEESLNLKMKNIDTELSALTTEYDTVKNLISKNVEKVFTMFST